jgi:hypothetical protein
MKITAFCLFWLSIFTAPGVMAQQVTTPNQSSTVPNQSWDLLRQLQAGEKIEVERKTVKKRISGKFVSLSDTELLIERKGKNESFSRNEVKNIWRVKPPGQMKRAMFDVIGGGLGYLCGFITAEAVNDEKYIVVVALATGAMMYAGFGLFDYLISKKGSKRILIYTAP